MTEETTPTAKQMQIKIDIGKIRQQGIFLMVPAYGGQCFAAFAKSMMELSAFCAQHGIPFRTHFLYNESLVQRARNYCADEFLRAKFQIKLEDESIEERFFEHGMFIDSDVEFAAQDVIVLAHLQNENQEYDVIGGLYPKKTIAWEKIKNAVDKGVADEDANKLEDFVGDYVFNPLSSGSIRLDQPAQVLETGTGFMMFRRDTLLKFKEFFPDLSYKPDHARTAHFDGSREIHTYFDCIIDPQSKRYLSEDYFFCRKVAEAGMKVWIVPWMRLRHHGYYVYGGNLAAMAAIGETATVNTDKIKKK